MATIYSNYKAITLSAGTTYSTADLGDGVSASTVHRIFCLGAGNVTVRPFEGTSFTWVAANANDYIDVVVSGLTVNTGSFIGFTAKNINQSYRGNGPY